VSTGPGAGDVVELVLVAGADELRRAVRDVLEHGESRLAVVVRDATGGGPARRGAPPRRYARRLPVRVAEGVVRFVDVDAIDWIEAANQYVRLHTGGARYLVRESLTRVASLLDPDRFVRVHRSAIVHVDRVVELRTTPTGRSAVLDDGTTVPVSRPAWEELQAALVGFPDRPPAAPQHGPGP
jgi:two-component system LytT family response regulator